jgi:hypothetical protein
MADDDDAFQRFEKLGIAEVEFLAPQWSGQLRGQAFRWLTKKREEERMRADASSSEQIRLTSESNAIALAAKAIAQHARALAIATLIVAIIGSAAAVAGLFIH